MTASLKRLRQGAQNFDEILTLTLQMLFVRYIF